MKKMVMEDNNRDLLEIVSKFLTELIILSKNHYLGDHRRALFKTNFASTLSY